MLSAGCMLGFLAWVSTMFLWWHLPTWLKLWTLRHPIITDFITGVVVFYTMSMYSMSIMSMVATVVAPLLMNFSMMALETSWARDRFELHEPPPRASLLDNLRNRWRQ